MQYVGAGRRFVAVLLDWLITGAVNFILGMVFLGGALFTPTTSPGAPNPNPTMSYLISLLIGIVYWVGYQGWAGQTLGKKVMGIKVVDEKGVKPSYFTFFLREIIGKFVSGIILFIGYLMILWDSKRQGLHDKIASTYVVKVQTASASIQPAVAAKV